MRRLFTIIAATLGVILLLLAGAFAYAQTSVGKDQIGGLIERSLSDPPASTAQVEGLSGLLPFDVRIGKVRLADDKGDWLAVDNARVRLSPTDLLAGRIFIREAGAERVRLDHLPAAKPGPKPPASSEPFSLPRLPEQLPAFAAERVYVDRLELGRALAGQEAVFKLDGGAGTSNDGRRLEARLDLVRTDQPTAEAELRADLDLGARQLDLALRADETGGLLAGLTGRPEAGALHLDLAAAGPFSDVRGKLAAQAENLARVDAQLGLAVEGMPRIDLTGRLTVAEGVLPPEVEPVVGRELDLRIQGGQRSRDLVAAEVIDVRGGGFALTGQGTAQLDSRTVNGQLDLTVPSLAVASGLAGTSLAGRTNVSVTASGDLYQPDVKILLNGEGITADVFGVARLGTTIDVRFLGPLDQGYAGVSVAGSGGADGVTMNGNPMPAAPAPRWSLAANVPAEGLARLDRFEVTADALTARATAAIDQATQAGTARLEVAAPDLAALVSSLGPLAPPGLAVSGALQLGADATIEDRVERVLVDLALDGTGLAGLPAGAQDLIGEVPKLTAHAVLSPGQEARVGTLTLNAAEMSLDGHLRAGLAPDDRALGGTLNVNLPRLAALSGVAGQPVAGQASAKVELGGTLDSPAVDLSATAEDVKAAGQAFDRIALTGKAAGPPDRLGGDIRLAVTQPQGELKLATAYQLASQMLDLKGLRLDGPGTRLGGDLQVNLAQLGASGELKGGISDLAALKPWHGQNLTGAVDLAARLSTPEGKQNARVDVNARQIAGDFGSLSAVAVQADATDALGTLGLDAKATVDGFQNPSATVEQALVTAKGSLADLRVTAEARGAQQAQPFNVASSARLQVAGARKQVELSTLTGSFAGQDIQLRAPANLTLDQGVLDLNQLDLRIGQAQVQGNARTSGRTIRASASIRELPLAMLASFGAPPIRGTANAQLNLSGSLAAPRADLRLAVPDLQPAASMASGLPPGNLYITGKVGDGRVSAELSLANLTQDPIRLSIAAPMTLALQPFAFALPPEGALSGRLQANADLARLAVLAALDGQRLAGPLSADLRLGGTIREPLVNGDLSLGPATVEDAITGIAYREVRVNLAAQGRRIVLSELTATSRGNGRITGDGAVSLAPDGTIPYRIETRMENAEVLRNDLGQVILSGTLGVNGNATGAAVRGRLEIQRADLQIPDGGGPSIPTLQVVEAGAPVEPGAGPTETAAPFDLSLDVTVDVPARLFVRGRGLDSEWGGKVTVQGSASDPEVLGEIRYRRGFLDFLDRRFTIREGVIAFTGANPPIPEVTLDAAAEGQGITAVVKVSGRADDPKLELTSEPPLPQDEVLAQLLFKRDMNSLTPAQGLRLASAVATLQGGGTDILGKFRQGLGLDTLDVGGTSATDANVRAGKYLSDNVYFEVQQGLQAGSGTARVEVELTPNLNVSTSVDQNSQTGVGVGWKMDY
jgi:translocation and assembly module TamB